MKSSIDGLAELHPYSIHPLPSTFLSKYDLTTQNIMRKDDIVLNFDNFMCGVISCLGWYRVILGSESTAKANPQCRTKRSKY